MSKKTSKTNVKEEGIPKLEVSPEQAFGEPEAVVPEPAEDRKSDGAGHEQDKRFYFVPAGATDPDWPMKGLRLQSPDKFVFAAITQMVREGKLAASETPILAGDPYAGKNGKNIGKYLVVTTNEEETAEVFSLAGKLWQESKGHGNRNRAPKASANQPGPENGDTMRRSSATDVRSSCERIADAIRRIEGMKEKNVVESLDYNPFLKQAREAELDAEDAIVNASVAGQTAELSGFVKQAEAALAAAGMASFENFREYVSGILERTNLGLSGENIRKLIVRVGEIETDVKSGKITTLEGKKLLFAVKEAALAVSNMEKHSSWTPRTPRGEGNKRPDNRGRRQFRD